MTKNISRTIRWQKYRNDIVKRKFFHIAVRNSNEKYNSEFKNVKKILFQNNEEINDFDKDQTFVVDFVGELNNLTNKTIDSLFKKINKIEKKNLSEVDDYFAKLPEFTKIDSIKKEFLKHNSDSIEMDFKKVNLKELK